MASNRRYPLKNCANPDCDLQPEFYPHDRRQKFCSAQCRTNYFNDKRSYKEKSLQTYLKLVEEQDQKLEIIYTILEYHTAPVEALIPHFFQIDFSVATTENLFSSYQEVQWFRSYGLVKLNKKGTYYRIICRNHI
jgi:hypothetical protein